MPRLSASNEAGRTKLLGEDRRALSNHMQSDAQWLQASCNNAIHRRHLFHCTLKVFCCPFKRVPGWEHCCLYQRYLMRTTRYDLGGKPSFAKLPSWLQNSTSSQAIIQCFLTLNGYFVKYGSSILQCIGTINNHFLPLELR